MNEQLNVIKEGDVFFTVAVFPYGFALLARKERLTCRLIKSIRFLDCAGGILTM